MSKIQRMHASEKHPCQEIHRNGKIEQTQVMAKLSIRPISTLECNKMLRKLKNEIQFYYTKRQSDKVSYVQLLYCNFKEKPVREITNFNNKKTDVRILPGEKKVQPLKEPWQNL